MTSKHTESNLNKNPFILKVLGLGKPYFVKTPWWLKMIYPHRLWNIDTKEKIVYLSFDDGPHPVATPFVLDELKKYNAKATFFCIGKNVVAYPNLYKRIIDEGNSVGNHTQNHINGWNTSTHDYLADVSEASKHIESNLFRPPYGRISSSQAKLIGKAMKKESAKIVMWDVLSGDFDESLSKEECFTNVIRNTKAGSIIVFHETETAYKHLEYTLTQLLQSFTKKGYNFKSL
jgi:peptidoglycan-N-acetylglucosamine deacetylase